jgi:hypothetical protein
MRAPPSKKPHWPKPPPPPLPAISAGGSATGVRTPPDDDDDDDDDDEDDDDDKDDDDNDADADESRGAATDVGALDASTCGGDVSVLVRNELATLLRPLNSDEGALLHAMRSTRVRVASPHSLQCSISTARN